MYKLFIVMCFSIFFQTGIRDITTVYGEIFGFMEEEAKVMVTSEFGEEILILEFEPSKFQTTWINLVGNLRFTLLNKTIVNIEAIGKYFR